MLRHMAGGSLYTLSFVDVPDGVEDHTMAVLYSWKFSRNKMFKVFADISTYPQSLNLEI